RKFQRRLKLRNGRFEIRFLQKSGAEILKVARVVGTHANRRFELGDGICRVPSQDQRQPQIIMRVRILWPELGEMAECSDRSFGIADALQQEAKTLLGISKIGLQASCLLQLLESLVRLQLILQQAAKVIMRWRALRSSMCGF